MSASITVDAKGRAALSTLKRLDTLIETGIKKGGYVSGKQITTFLKKGFRAKPKSGREYLIRRGKIRRRHIASNPDVNPPEFPASLSGALANSVGFNVKGSDQLIFGAGTEDGKVPYARILNDGGQAGRGRKTTIKGRFYLEQTAKANERNITRNIEDEIEKLLK